MRIALYLAGHTRTYDATIEQNILQHFEGHELDVFVSTYSRLERRAATHQYGHDVTITRQQALELYSGLPVKGLVVYDEREFYPCLCMEGDAEYDMPTERRVTDRGLPDRDPKTCPKYCENCKPEGAVKSDVTSCYWMWKNVWNCHQMAINYEMSNGIRYDYHVRSRPDLILFEKVAYERLGPLCDKLLLGFGATAGSPDDMFAIGQGDAMKDYCDIEKVVKYNLGNHEVVGYTLARYPMAGQVPMGVVRFWQDPQPGKYHKQIGDNKWLMWYDRNQWRIPPIPYAS